MATRIQLRHDTSGNWSQTNPILYPGEFGIETDTLKIKVGPLVDSPAVGTAWNSISTYVNVTGSDLSNSLGDYIALADLGNAGGPAELTLNGNLLVPGQDITLEGSTADSYELTIRATDPTADRIITLPDASGTVALESFVDNAIASFEALPSQSGHTNQYLKTDGSVTSWAALDLSVKQDKVTGVSDTEIGYLDGVTSSIQTQLNDKQSIVSGVSNTEIGYLDGVTSAIQSQFNAKASLDDLASHESDTTNIHGISDTAKLATKAYVATAIDNLIDMAPTLLNTLNEISAAINDDPNFASTVGTAISNAAVSAEGYTDSAINTHNQDTTSIHGIADTSLLATKSYADGKASTAQSNAATYSDGVISTEVTNRNSAIQAHSDSTSGVHGIAGKFVGTTDTQNLSNKTFINDVLISSTTNSNTTTAGALVVNGGIGVIKNIHAGGTAYFGADTTLNLTDPLAFFTKDVNSYTQVGLQNTSNGGSASADLVITADNGSNTTNFIDLGVASSGYNDSQYTSIQPNDGYLLMDGGNLVLNASTAGKAIDFYVGGTLITDKVGSWDENSLEIVGDLSISGTTTGITKTMVGLSNVNNTSDASKPVSTATQTALDSKLSLTGGTMTGLLTLSGTPTTDLHAATKAYVDGIAAGINFHEAVKSASVSNLAANYYNGTNGYLATLTADTNREFNTLDSQSISVNDRVLIKNQTDAKQNGIYVLTSNGVTGSSPWVLTRAADADNNPAGELKGGDFCFVTLGSTYANTGFIVSNTSTITIGVDNINYTQFNAAQALTAGYGIAKDGAIISVDNTVIAPLASPTFTGTVTLPAGTVTSGMILDGTITNTDINASAAIADTKLATISTSGKVANSATTAASLNTANAIVARNASGDFAAGTITATLVGNADSATNSTSSTNAANIAIANDTTTNASVYPTWVTANTGNLGQKVSSTKLSFNPSTGILTSTGFSGSGAGLTGLLSSALNNSSVTIGSTPVSLGSVVTTIAGLTSVTSTSFTGALTGNASTATKLAATKNINGTAFDGSADITITAAGSTLTGTSLASNILSSSLTSVGTLSSLTTSGNVIVGGNLTVNGTTTTVNSTTLAVTDKNIELANGTSTDVAADGGGITLHGTTDKTFNWVAANTAWTSSENIDLASGKTIKIAGTNVLTGSALGSGITGSSLTSVGTLINLTVTNTITGSISGNAGTVTNGVYTTGSYSDPTWLTISKSKVGLANVENTALSTWAGSTNITTLGTIATGTWSATAIATTKGGTGLTGYSSGDILYASATDTLAKLAKGTDGQILTLASGIPSWSAAPTSLPSQTGNTGKYLTTNGTSASWGTLSVPISTATISITGNTATTLDTTALSAFTSIEYMVSLKQGTKIRTSKVLVQTDGTSVDMTEFAITETGGTISSVTIAGSVSSTNCILTATVTDASSTNVTAKISRVSL